MTMNRHFAHALREGEGHVMDLTSAMDDELVSIECGFRQIGPYVAQLWVDGRKVAQSVSTTWQGHTARFRFDPPAPGHRVYLVRYFRELPDGSTRPLTVHRW